MSLGLDARRPKGEKSFAKYIKVNRYFYRIKNNCVFPVAFGVLIKQSIAQKPIFTTIKKEIVNNIEIELHE